MSFDENEVKIRLQFSCNIERVDHTRKKPMMENKLSVEFVNAVVDPKKEKLQAVMAWCQK